MIWGTVERRAAKVAILAGGLSLAGWPVERLQATGAYVLAVNHAVLAAPWADGWCTVDSESVDAGALDDIREWPGEKYVAARAARPPAAPMDGATYLLSEHRWRWGRPPEPIAAGWNSAYGALQIAALMEPEAVALFGVDLRTDTAGRHWYGRDEDEPGHSYRKAVQAYEQLAAAGPLPFRMVNGSPRSAVTGWPRMTPDAAADWLAGQ